MNYDVAIIGAGIVGAACAAHLAGSGLTTAIIESKGIASGTTAAGMGHIVVMDDTEAQFALTDHSQKLWNSLANELPPAGEFENCGTIWVAADDLEMEEVQRKHSFYGERGVRSRILGPVELRELEPNLRRGLAGGLLVSGDSVVYQMQATRYLIGKAQNNGADLILGQDASEITDGGVKLADGTSIKAKRVVNAAGAAAPTLSPELKIVRRKGHLVITDRYRGFARHQLVELGYLRSAHSLGADSVAFNIQPRSTGQVLLGSSRQFGAENGDIDYDILRRMTSRAFEYMPALQKLATVRVWTGFRPATPDNLPYIGRLPGDREIYVAAGHEGLGITTSLGTAELIADAILGREPAIAAEPYSPARLMSEH